MKTTQYIFLFAGVVFIAATLYSIEQELAKINDNVFIIRDGVKFSAVQEPETEKSPVREKSQTS